MWNVFKNIIATIPNSGYSKLLSICSGSVIWLVVKLHERNLFKRFVYEYFMPVCYCILI